MARDWISMADYLGRYAADADTAVRIAAGDLLVSVNELLDVAHAEGVPLYENPATDNMVSGTQNGGYRPHYVRVGAPESKHRTGHAVDVFDPRRELAAWCIQNVARLVECGLAMENPRWTPTWVHLQDLLPASGRQVFIPSNDPPLAKALPEQVVA